MIDKKDNAPSEKSAKSELTTSSSIDKPLLDEDPPEKAADIDTSHLTLDESSGQPGSTLEKEQEVEAPAINTSYLSLEKEENIEPTGKPAVDLPSGNGEKVAGSSSEDQMDEIDLSADEPESAQEQLEIKNPLAQNLPDADSDVEPDTEPSSENIADASENNEADDQVMLTTDIPDAEFDKEMLDSTTDKAPGKSPDNEDEENPEGPIQSILETVKKPEKVVRNAWTNSSARRFLIDNVESFRVKDEDQNMESVIEKMYGGKVENKFTPGKFLKDNLLFSFLLFLFLFLVGWKVAGIFFPEFMPRINDQIIETVQNTTSRIKADKPADKKKPVVINIGNKAQIDEALSNCLVEPDARMAFSSAFAAVGYEFSDHTLTLSYEETKDSIKVWQDMDMGYYIKDAILRFSTLAMLSLPAIQDAQNTVADYKQSLINISEQTDGLENRIRDIQTAGGNQSTYTVNERIPLRNQLDRLNARLVEEPDLARFDHVLKKITLVENILSGREKPARVEPDQLTVEDPEWLMSTAESASETIATPIREKVLPAIQTPAGELKKVFPKLTAFHLSQLDKALDDLLKLSALITFLPENMLTPYKLELSGLSRRLNDTMEKEFSTWMSFDRCLTKERGQVSEATE
ncbi:MAG: hypothetical protein U9N50_04215 [Pseudomonadota bacterium]|nr:hypothetical protein [Pseudomonadota bacterium]